MEQPFLPTAKYYESWMVHQVQAIRTELAEIRGILSSSDPYEATVNKARRDLKALNEELSNRS